MVHEAVGGEHLKHMWQLNQHLTDGTCFWHVLRDNLKQEKQKDFLNYLQVQMKMNKLSIKIQIKL